MGATSAQAPKRIQRKRTKGWRMPAGAVYVGRPTRYGNPYEVAIFGRDLAVMLFQRSLSGYWTPTGIPDALVDAAYKTHSWMQACRRVNSGNWVASHLRGKDLACWCPLVDKDGNHVPCHADVLLEIANG